VYFSVEHYLPQPVNAKGLIVEEVCHFHIGGGENCHCYAALRETVL
jgi:hypothetical protein